MGEELEIRPYARLITMLGEQLIKNETIALVELIKNSYDADASWVSIKFENFGDDYSINSKSKIIIEDDGWGMDENIVKKHWVNPATPEKLLRKKEKSKTAKGRILQGEKGIGRFAIFKLGKTIELITRSSKNEKDTKEDEIILSYDFSIYDDDFLEKKSSEEQGDIFLSDLKIFFNKRVPKTIIPSKVRINNLKEIIRKPHGTRIEISNLIGKWSLHKIKEIQKNISKLQPIFGIEEKIDFTICFKKDKNIILEENEYINSLRNLIETRSVLKIEKGHFDSKKNQFSYYLNNSKIVKTFDDPEISGLKVFKDDFNGDVFYKSECGDFEFNFYIFDFNNSFETRYQLDKKDKKIIKEHRVYLYRDNIRVMPYGDIDDDWLSIDVSRGTESAGAFLSNDQVVGFVQISQKNNPKLRDKTNREGLVEEDSALQDFIKIIRLFLRYIRKITYARYVYSKKEKKEIDDMKSEKPVLYIEKAKKYLEKDEKGKKIIESFEKSYIKEKQVLNNRISQTENLAAVGLSIETASHDTILFLKRAMSNLENMIKDISVEGIINTELLLENLIGIQGNLSIVNTQLTDIQQLFPSTKSRKKNIRVKDLLIKVHNFYKRIFNENNISFEIEENGSPLIVKTTDAVILQLLINLFDNSTYWVLTKQDAKKKISVLLDGENMVLIFSDNGPGFHEEDIKYVFESFYSGKGEDGRGLGLYIAKQLLERYNYSISVIENISEKRLEGANIIVDFLEKSEEDN